MHGGQKDIFFVFPNALLRLPLLKDIFYLFPCTKSENSQFCASSEHHSAPLLAYPRWKRLLPQHQTLTTRVPVFHVVQIAKRSVSVQQTVMHLLPMSLSFWPSSQNRKLQCHKAYLFRFVHKDSISAHRPYTNISYIL